MKLTLERLIAVNFTVLFTILFNTLPSQTELLNHKKYYYYKTRLQNDFMKIGLLDGESIPFNERGYYDAAGPNEFFNPFTNFPESGNGTLKAGDASARLGIYLSGLATEYRLLKNNGQDVSKVKHELFCALNAINRIDYNAEYLIGSSNNPGNSMGQTGSNLNGFFVRDDIQADFVKNNYKHFNYYNNGVDVNGNPLDQANDKGFTQTYTYGQKDVSSDCQRFLNEPLTKLWNNGTQQDPCVPGNTECISPCFQGTCLKKGILNGFEESQDQVIYIMMGCALVKELVDANETDNGAVFGYGAGGSSLKQQAIDIVDRIITHIKNDPAYNIRNPANSNAYVQTGQLAGFVSYAIDNAACFIKYNGSGGDYSSNDMPNYYKSGLFSGSDGYPYNACTDFRNTVSSSSAGLWHSSMGANFLNNLNNNSILSVLASVCNCYYESKFLKDLNIAAQIQSINQQINQAWENLQNQLSGIPSWLEAVINALISAVTQATTILGGILTNLANDLWPSININSTDDKLTFFTKSSTFYYENCSGNNVQHIGSDLIFPVYVRDILHQNNANLSLPSNYSGYTNNPGHLQLKNDLQNVLNTAPCQGNYYMYPNYPVANWGASNRCDLTTSLWKIQCASPQGEFAGTDYMLLHNLYYLREGSQIGLIDYQDRKVTVNLPLGTEFTPSNKRTIGAFEYIKASNIVNANAAVDYRAGKEIAFLPGFSAVNGCDFSAIINPFNGTCNNDDMFRTNGGNNKDEIFEGVTNYENKPAKNDYAYDINAVDLENQPENYNLKTQIDSLLKNLSKNETNLLSKIEVYPNPNNGEFNIDFNLTNIDNISFEIASSLGQIVYQDKLMTGSFILPVNLKHVVKGIYIIKFTDKNGIRCAKRITIQ